MFITFEGGEGVGKSTQIRLLADRIRQSGREVVITREPGGTPFAELIRSYILGGQVRHLGPAAEARFFAIARREHVLRLLKPSLERGAVVLCDRFVDSTRALQGAGGVDDRLLEELVQRAAGDCMPDLTLMLQAGGDVTARRRRDRGGTDRFELEKDDFHEEVVRRFAAIALREPERVVPIDANGSVEDVAFEIEQVVSARLPEMRLLSGPAVS